MATAQPLCQRLGPGGRRSFLRDQLPEPLEISLRRLVLANLDGQLVPDSSVENVSSVAGSLSPTAVLTVWAEDHSSELDVAVASWIFQDHVPILNPGGGQSGGQRTS